MWNNAWSSTSIYRLFCNLFKSLVVVYPLPWPLFVGGVRSSRFWSTSQLIPPSGQQLHHSSGSVHKSRGDNVVHMWMQLKRWCVWMLQRGHSGDGCVWHRLCVSMIWGREIYLFLGGQLIYTISCSLMNRAIITLNFYNQATRSKVTTIIVGKFIKHEQRRKYCAIL